MQLRWNTNIAIFIWGLFFCGSLMAQDTLPVAGGDSLGTDSLALADSLQDPTIPVVDTTAPVTDSAVAAVEAAYVDDGLVTFNLSSPYHTVLTHLYFLQEDSYHPDSAALTLYVRGGPHAEDFLSHAPVDIHVFDLLGSCAIHM